MRGVASVGMAAEGGAIAASKAEYVQVQTTTDSRTEAMELARLAVELRLAACAQVAGPMTSTYWWDEGIERAEEWLVMLKLPADRYEALAEMLTDRHSYDEPEIIVTPIIAGSETYLSWIREETRPRSTENAGSLRLAAGASATPRYPTRIGFGLPARPAPPCRRGSARSLFRGRDVPSQDDRLAVFGAERRNRAGVQAEQPPAGRFELKPAGGEDPQNVTVRDERDVAVRQQRAHAGQNPVGPGPDFLDRLAGMVGVARDHPVPP